MRDDTVVLEFRFRARVPSAFSVEELTQRLREQLADSAAFDYQKSFGVAIQLPLIGEDLSDD